MYNNYNFAYKPNFSNNSGVAATSKLEDRISYDITEDLDFERLLTMFEITVVDVWAQWCEPCKRIADSYEALGKKYVDFMQQKRIIFLKDDIDSDGSIHREHIEAVPTFFIYYKTKLYKKIIGTEFDEIDGIIEGLLRGEGEFMVENEHPKQTFEGI